MTYKNTVILLSFVFTGSLLIPHVGFSKIGYGSSDAVYSEKNQEYFFDGFNLALDRYLSEEAKQNYMLNMKVRQMKDKKHLSALRAAKELIGANSAVVAGFPTSHEALLVSKLAQKEEVVFISAAASHSDIQNQGKFVLSMGESAVQTTSALLDFANRKFKNTKGLVITDKSHVFSANQTKMILETNASSKKPKRLTVQYLDSKKMLPQNVIEDLKSNKYGFIALTTYADDTIQLLEQFIAEKVVIPIIANSSWTIGNIGLIRRLLVHLQAEIFCVASVVKGANEALDFEKFYSDKYGRKPETEMYYGYDMGVVVAKTINRIGGPVTKQSFYKTLYKNLCFNGATTGRVCFPSTGGHVRRKINWLKFEVGKGFVPSRI